MTTHTLTRTGKAPLTFSGELLASESSHGSNTNRWHEAAIYRTEGGPYVVAIEYHTQWESELGHFLAEQCATPATVVEELTGYDPTQHVRGYPEGAQFQQRQVQLLRDIRSRYEALVSEILASSEEFAERIE